MLHLKRMLIFRTNLFKSKKFVSTKSLLREMINLHAITIIRTNRAISTKNHVNNSLSNRKLLKKLFKFLVKSNVRKHAKNSVKINVKNSVTNVVKTTSNHALSKISNMPIFISTLNKLFHVVIATNNNVQIVQTVTATAVCLTMSKTVYKMLQMSMRLTLLARQLLNHSVKTIKTTNQRLN